MVRPRVARATEGAAPKSPAKDFGRKMSPRMAKRLTTVPPMKKRRRRSRISSGLLSLLDEGLCGCDTFAAEKLVFLTFEIVIVDEEELDLLEELLWKVAETLDVGVLTICFGYCNETVVSNRFVAVHLLAGDDTYEAGGNKDTGGGGFVHEDEN